MIAASPRQLTTDRAIPQVLLFGRSGAGKSALLGALFQVGEQKGETLLGEVQESTGRLAALRDATYRGASLEPTHAELTSYSIRLRPWRDDSRSVGAAASVLIHDCSGLAAASLIQRPEAIGNPETPSPLARALAEADAIVLLVDASVTDAELHASFEEFRAFLHAVGLEKASAREVGGFPSYLVLTQCDKLAQPGDTRSKWEARADARAEWAWERFNDFLKSANHEEDGPTPFLAFGSLALLVYAVAIRRPRLSDAPGQPAVPYNVAELFSDCFAAATAHRARVRTSNTRLRWTLRGALMAIGILLLVAIGVSVFEPHTDSQLADEIIAFQMREPPDGARLEDANRQRDKQILTGFKDNPGFNSLPRDLQEFINGRLKEIDDYDRYQARLDATTSPGECRSLEELGQVEHTLLTELAFPDGYDWTDTPAGTLRTKWLADVASIRKTEGEFVDQYRKRILRGIGLLTTSSLGGSWRANVVELVSQPLRLPISARAILPPALQEDLWRDMNFDPIVELNAPLPGSPEVPARRGAAVTYRVPYEFERVYQVRKEWRATRDRLKHLRDLADALGLTAGANLPAKLLELPEPGPGVNATTLPTERWTSLSHTYPEARGTGDEWTLSNFPEPGRKLLAERLERSFQTGVRYVHELIRARMTRDGMVVDTPESWRVLAGALTNPATPFPAWGKLLHFYTGLRKPDATNPVDDLVSFLRRPFFTLDLRELKLTIPLDLAIDKVYPAGPMTITLGQGERTRTATLKSSGEGMREGSATIYRFVSERARKSTFVPGEAFRAELPVRSGMQEFKLVWEKTNSRTYPFDLFLHEPRLVKSDGSSEPALGVKVALEPKSELPHSPVLFPEGK